MLQGRFDGATEVPKPSVDKVSSTIVDEGEINPEITDDVRYKIGWFTSVLKEM